MGHSKILLSAATCAAAILANVGSARALELKDLIIKFDSVYSSGSYAMKSKTHLNAIGGQIITHGMNCNLEPPSFVYKPGSATGTVKCPTVRHGTDLNYLQWDGHASYQTTMTVTGNTITLEGKMTGVVNRRVSNCGVLSALDENVTVTQSIVVTMVGNTCRIVRAKTETYTEHRLLQGSWMKMRPPELATSTLAPGGKCTVSRRSLEPPTTPPEAFTGVMPSC